MQQPLWTFMDGCKTQGRAEEFAKGGKERGGGIIKVGEGRSIKDARCMYWII